MRNAFTAFALGLTMVAGAAPALANGFNLPQINERAGPVDQPRYGYSYGAGYYGNRVYGGGPQWENPGFFAAHVHDELRSAGTDLRDHVHQGRVRPQALAAFQYRRGEIESDLQSASMDGVITPYERQRILQDVDALRFIDARFRYGNGVPRGGGPGWGGWR
jgi:hypothetical protein